MAISTVVEKWLVAEAGADPAAKKKASDNLVTSLWATYGPYLYTLARRLFPGQQSDILNSGFKKFTQQLEKGKVKAITGQELFRLLKRRIRDKVSERIRKDQRRRDIIPVFAENELIREPSGERDNDSGINEGMAEWAISREPPPEFPAMIEDLLHGLPERCRNVLLLKIQEPEPSNADIARILRITDREVGRRLKRAGEDLARKCEWFREEAERRKAAKDEQPDE